MGGMIIMMVIKIAFRCRPKSSFDVHHVVGWSSDLDKIKEVKKILNKHHRNEYKRVFGVLVVRNIIIEPLNEYEFIHLLGIGR
jgi:hypothetical protein